MGHAGDDLHPLMSVMIHRAQHPLPNAPSEAQLTILPSLAPATAFLALQNCLATFLAVALQRFLARFIRWEFRRAVAVEGDGK